MGRESGERKRMEWGIIQFSCVIVTWGGRAWGGTGGRWNRFGRGDKIMASCAPPSLSQKCNETMPKLRKWGEGVHRRYRTGDLVEWAEGEGRLPLDEWPLSVISWAIRSMTREREREREVPYDFPYLIGGTKGDSSLYCMLLDLPDVKYYEKVSFLKINQLSVKLLRIIPLQASLIISLKYLSTGQLWAIIAHGFCRLWFVAQTQYQSNLSEIAWVTHKMGRTQRFLGER